MSIPIIEPPVTDWWCPNCKATDQTKVAGLHQRYHTCPKLRYLSAPMVRKGIKAKVIIHEREEYVGREIVQYDPEQGRPVMSVETVRDNGNDLIVLAPMARAALD